MVEDQEGSAVAELPANGDRTGWPVAASTASANRKNFSTDPSSTNPSPTNRLQKYSHEIIHIEPTISNCGMPQYGLNRIDNDLLLQQEEYFFENDREVAPSQEVSSGHTEERVTDTSSSSVSAIPGGNLLQNPPRGLHEDFQLSSLASSFFGSHATSNTRQPVLYSAIGSLEDPSSSSYGATWKKRNTRKFEFPSTNLLPPVNQVKPITSKSRQKLVRSSLTSEMEGLSRNKSKSPTNVVAPNTDAPIDGTTTEDHTTPDKSDRKSNLRTHQTKDDEKKNVTIADSARRKAGRKSKKGPQEMFRPSSDAYTPRMGKKEIKYKPAEMRTPVQQMASPLGTLQRPNFRDALRRVAMIIHQHIVKIEHRFESKNFNDDLFSKEMKDLFDEENFVTPIYKCCMVRVPMARSGMVYGLKKIRRRYDIPSEGEIYEFAHQLFKTVQLSPECSIVCLIYVERLMEVAKVPVLASTWRPIFMCGLLLASKVWQDLSSWNIEFASVYPQYSLDSINRLELLFLRMVKWDLYISSRAYAKYYFALRSLVEKTDFRQRYNRMVGGVNSVQASEALKIEKRSSQVKEEALLHLSRSM